MQSVLYRVLLVLMLGFVAAPICGEPYDKNIVSRTADIDGVKLHYLTGGHGPTVILLHGYAETSRMWRPIIPVLAEKFTVIAPDLPALAIPEFRRTRSTWRRPRVAFTRSLDR
jgi:pimeloyl-ACP methyl ester carboxylesterase